MVQQCGDRLCASDLLNIQDQIGRAELQVGKQGEHGGVAEDGSRSQTDVQRQFFGLRQPADLLQLGLNLPGDLIKGLSFSVRTIPIWERLKI